MLKNHRSVYSNSIVFYSSSILVVYVTPSDYIAMLFQRNTCFKNSEKGQGHQYEIIESWSAPFSTLEFSIFSNCSFHEVLINLSLCNTPTRLCGYITL